MDYLCANLNNAGAGECRSAGDAFVKHRAQGEEVAAAVDRFSRSLFGRKIKLGSDDDVAACLGGGQGFLVGIAGQRSRLDNVFDETKIQYLDLATFGYHHV